MLVAAAATVGWGRSQSNPHSFRRRRRRVSTWDVLNTMATDPELHHEDATVTRIEARWWCAGDSVYGEGGNEDE